MKKRLTKEDIVGWLSADALRYYFPGVSLHQDTCFSIVLSEDAPDLSDTRFSISSGPEPQRAVFTDRTPVTIQPEHRHPNCKTVHRPELDPRTEIIIAELDSLCRKYGVTISEIEKALEYRVELSHLKITRSHAVILEDFDSLEVRMDTLTKAVFLLFLKHEEGIRYKDLPDHRPELEEIYMSISGRSDLEAMRKSIDDLVDPINSNSINEKVSKVKRAFRNVVDDRIARHYYIDGRPGDPKLISLDRSLVIWG